MTENSLLEEKIRELRMRLHDLIDSKTDFLDPEVIETSKELDELLNQYKNEKDKNENS